MVLDCQLKDDDLNGGGGGKESRTAEAQAVSTPKKQRAKLVGCSEQIELARSNSQKKPGPEPWLTRKFAVGMVIAIFFYSYYVFVVRLSIPMVTHHPHRRGGRAQGIIYLTIYHFLFILFIWSYAIAITTPPGFASDYVPQSDPPKEDRELIQVEGYRFEDFPIRENEGAEQRGLDRTSEETEDDGNGTTVVDEDQNSGTAADAEEIRPSPPPTIQQSVTFPSVGSSNHVVKSSISSSQPRLSITSSSSPALPRKPTTARLSTASSGRSFLHFPPPPENCRHEPPKNHRLIDRIPPNNTPVLKDDWRYDVREGILRPYRSHRCKHCDRIVLKMDHHCPWVGACVGARNYKYFYNFLQASTLYTVLVTISLIIPQTLPSPHPPTDGNLIAITALAGLFTFFTASLWLAHTRLILLNLTTIEDLANTRMKAREREILIREFGWGLKAHRYKKMTVERWNSEWGRIGKEGNLWCLGSSRKNWEMVMGESKWGWFLPIPASPKGDDGLSYVPNPRFSKDGMWRMRAEWPEELR